MGSTEAQYSAATKLKRISWLSARDPEKKFGGLMHHFNKESLTASFNRLDGKKAVGADGISKEQYGESLGKRSTIYWLG